MEVEDDVSNGGGGSIRESNNGFGWYRFLGRIFFRGVWWFYFFLVVVLVVLGKEFYFFFQIGEWLGCTIGDVVDVLIPSYFYESEREVVDKTSGEFLGFNSS